MKMEPCEFTLEGYPEDMFTGYTPRPEFFPPVYVSFDTLQRMQETWQAKPDGTAFKSWVLSYINRRLRFNQSMATVITVGYQVIYAYALDNFTVTKPTPPPKKAVIADCVLA